MLPVQNSANYSMEEMFFKAPLREVLYWNDFENTALHSLQETESAPQHVKQILQ